MNYWGIYGEFSWKKLEPQTTPPTFLLLPLFFRLYCPDAPAAVLAKVSTNESAKSVDLPRRFLVSALLSTSIFPDELNEYRGAVRSAMRLSSFGICTSSVNHCFVASQSSARRLAYRSAIAGDSLTFTPRALMSSSLRRSSTPAPNPMLSTKISSGGSSAEFKRSSTRPLSSIRDNFFQLCNSIR